jgi:hypothetical protein
MNWRQGLVRAWIVLSIGWIAFWSWFLDLICEFNFPHYGGGPWCAYQASDMAYHAKSAAIILGPPIGGALAGWVLFGFVGRSRP